MGESWRPNRAAIYWPPPNLPAIIAFLSCSLGLLNGGTGGPASLGLGPRSSIFSPTAAAQSGTWGPTLLGSGFLYRNLSSTGWTSCAPSYIIVRRTPSSCGRHKSHSFNPSTVNIFLLFTQVHFLFWKPGRVGGQYKTVIALINLWRLICHHTKKLSLCMLILQYKYLYVYVSIYLFVCVCINLSTHTYMHVFVHLSINLTMSVCLSVSVSLSSALILSLFLSHDHSILVVSVHVSSHHSISLSFEPIFSFSMLAHLFRWAFQILETDYLCALLLNTPTIFFLSVIFIYCKDVIRFWYIALNIISKKTENQNRTCGNGSEKQ